MNRFQEVEDGTWAVYFCDQELDRYDERAKKLQR